MTQAVTPTASPQNLWPLERLVETLTYFQSRPSPATLEQARLQREALTPILLDSLRRVARTPDEVEHGDSLHVSAIYLLAEFQETAALPLVIELFSMEMDDIEEFFGDIPLESGHRILASVCGGDSRPLRKLAETAIPNEYVRWAGLEAMVVLVGAGQLAREEALQYFGYLMRIVKAPAGDPLWAGLVGAATDLYPLELKDEIRHLYEQDLPGPHWDTLEQTESIYATPMEAHLAATFSNPTNRLIDDAYEAMAWLDPRVGYIPPAPAISVGRGGPEPGRNDPCWCGSGQKYKKCCLKR